MTVEVSVYAPLTNAASKAPAVKQPAMNMKRNTTKKPWRETPLVESANLSEAAGWSVFPYVNNYHPQDPVVKPQKQNLPQARDPTALRLLQKPRNRPLLPSSAGTLRQPRTRPLLRLIRRECRAGLCFRSQVTRMSIDSRRPSINKTDDDN